MGEAERATTTIPAEARSIVEKLRDDLVKTAGKNLAALVVYGGLARGRYRGAKSDLNVAVFLHQVDGAALRQIAPLLREAWRSARVEPIILTPGEVRRTAEAFPLKFLDMMRHNVLLHGDNPLRGLAVDEKLVRLRVKQELSNLELGLRRRVVSAGDDPAGLYLALHDTLVPLKVNLAELLRIRGTPAADDETATVYAASAMAFTLDHAKMDLLAKARHEEIPESEAGVLLDWLVETLPKLVTLAEGAGA